VSSLSGVGWAALLVAWLLVGGLVAGRLRAAGEGWPAALVALPCWPLMVTALGAPPRGRVDEALSRLDVALRSAGESVDLGALRESLLAAEARLGRFDQLLRDLADAAPQDLTRLRAARATGEGEIEAVLAELVRLRVQLGLSALRPEAVPVRARLAELAARVAAIEEVSRSGDGVPDSRTAGRYCGPPSTG
jgi:hypothetical protein